MYLSLKLKRKNFVLFEVYHWQYVKTIYIAVTLLLTNNEQYVYWVTHDCSFF